MAEPSVVPPDPPATPSALSAHLARFRYSSPRSSPSASAPRRSPRKPSAPAAEAPQESLAPPSPVKPPINRRATATPPRADGSSRHFKRTASSGLDEEEEESGEDATETPRKKRKRPARPYADPSVYAHLGEDPLTDYMVHDGKLFLCGINPGKMSAEQGLHYANPTNHYWRCLAGSGLTDRLLLPSEGPLLAEQYGISATNLVPRPSAEMSEISKAEMVACVPALLHKVIAYRPLVVGFVGMKICEVVMRYLHNLPPPLPPGSTTPAKKKRKPAMPKVKVGLQPVSLLLPPVAKGAGRRRIHFWCLPSTSARVVEYQLNEKIKIFSDLKADIDRLTSDPPQPLDLPATAVEYSSEVLFPPELDVKKEEEGEEKPTAGGWAVTMIKAEDLQGGVKSEAERE
ncbi:hypothetical protein JCM8097_002287 [Rhodosporidiobolus ruineniae]